MSSGIVGNNQRTSPDVFFVEVHYHPDRWANGDPPDTYKFRVIGGTWGLNRWAVHAIWADRPMPNEKNISLPKLREVISQSLEQQTQREITSWGIDCLAWEERQ